MIVSVSVNASEQIIADCGSWVTLTARPTLGARFLNWSDGSTDISHRVEVTENATYFAYFEDLCSDRENLPVVALYDWLLLLNVRSIHEDLGLTFDEASVRWYRVRGQMDDIDSENRDDELVATGVYLTLAKDLSGTGDYYALVDVSGGASGLRCMGMHRSIIIQYAGTEQDKSMALMPTCTRASSPIRLVGLRANVESVIKVYDAVGRLLFEYTSYGVDELTFPTASIPGCYCVVVEVDGEKTILKYLTK